MRKFILLSCCPLILISLISLNGCSWMHFYQPDIQQGNVLPLNAMQQLHVGMSKGQVQQLLGTPVLNNVFNDNHWAYVYTFQHKGGKISKKQLDLYFNDNDILQKITQG